MKPSKTVARYLDLINNYRDQKKLPMLEIEDSRERGPMSFGRRELRRLFLGHLDAVDIQGISPHTIKSVGLGRRHPNFDLIFKLRGLIRPEYWFEFLTEEETKLEECMDYGPVPVGLCRDPEDGVAPIGLEARHASVAVHRVVVAVNSYRTQHGLPDAPLEYTDIAPMTRGRSQLRKLFGGHSVEKLEIQGVSPHTLKSVGLGRRKPHYLFMLKLKGLIPPQDWFEIIDDSSHEIARDRE